MKVCAYPAQEVLPEAHPWPKWSIPTLCVTTAQLQVTRAAAHLILCSEHLTLVCFFFFWQSESIGLLASADLVGTYPVTKWNNCHWLLSSVHPTSHCRLISISFAKFSCAGLGMLGVQTAGRCNSRAGPVDHFLRLLRSQSWWCKFGPLTCTSAPDLVPVLSVFQFVWRAGALL